MKKILFVATTAKSHINTFHLPHIKFLQDEGYQVHVATNGDEKVSLADKEFSLPISRNPLRIGNLFAIFKLARIMRKQKYDLITCHTPMGGVVARVAAFFSKSLPIIYMAHGFHFYKGAPFVNNIYKVIEKILAHITDAIITMNEEDYAAAKKFSLRKNGKVYKIPGIGLDTKKFFDLDIDVKSKRNSLGVDENAIVILNVAEMIKRKNQATLLKAFAKIDCDRAILLICGRGKLQAKLKNLARKLDIEHKVKFLGFRKDIREILAISDIFVFPSFQEGLPLSVIEAMAAKLPIVCSNIRGNKDLIHNNENGFLVDCKDVVGFAQKIQLLCQDKSLRGKFGGQNSKVVFKYDLSNVISQMRQIYTEIFS